MARRSKKSPRWLYAVLALLLGALVLALLLSSQEQQQGETRASVVVVGPSANSAGATKQRDKPEPLDFAFEELTESKDLQAPREVASPLHIGKPEAGIALVMDDVGYDIKALERVLSLPFPVAISVLPDSPAAAQAATMAYESGQIVMLHLPMEPTSPKYRAKMSSSFLRADMNAEQIDQHFYQALAEVPYVTGVNNHMGSLLTTLESPMQRVMSICRERGLFFIDSKTSNSSVAADIAAKQGVAWAARRIFLDHTVEAEDLEMAWASAVRCARQQESCIVIAHPHAETLNFLEQRVKTEEYKLMLPVTAMLHAEGGK